MRLIVGIGNPERRYLFNRHNVGFMLLDFLANKHSVSFTPSKKDYYFSEGKIGQVEFSLIKPATYVNNSGEAVLQAMQYYNSGIEDLLVIHDDLNIEFLKFKIKSGGGDGGHNGIKSIIYYLQNGNFARLRIGIGNNFEKGEMAKFVLSDFSDEEFKELKKVFDLAAFLIEEFILGGIKQMLNANSRLAKNNSDAQDNPGSSEK